MRKYIEGVKKDQNFHTIVKRKTVFKFYIEEHLSNIMQDVGI